MEIIAVLLVLAFIYALLHPFRTLGLIFRIGVVLVILIIIFAIIGGES